MNIDYTQTSMSITPATSAAATSWNTTCNGSITFTAGTAVDVAGKTCGTTTSTANAITVYGIYMLESATRLEVSNPPANDLMGSATTATRPTTLTTGGYIKQ
jgi:hypothetical protein